MNNKPRTRREFLADVGCGMLVATVGYEVAGGLGLSSALAEEASDALSFGALEPLVCLMQETPVDRLMPLLVGQLRSGADLRKLTAAAALANARTFGGEDYVGFHTMMALAPALHLSQELPAESQRELPGGLHLHLHGVKAEDIAAILVRETLRDRR